MRVAPAGGRAERYCLALLLRYPELREEGLTLPAELFLQSENRQLFELWQRFGDLEGAGQELPDGVDEQVRRVLATQIPPFDNRAAKAALQKCVDGLNQRQLKAAKQASSAALAAYEADAGAVDPEELEALARAWRSDSSAEALDLEGISEAGELQLRDMEIGIRLHQHSKIGSVEEDA